MQQERKMKVDMAKKRRKLVAKSVRLSKLRRKIFKHVWLTRSVVFLSVTASLYLMVLLFAFLLNQIGVIKYLKAAKSFIFTPGQAITQFENRTNILLLGKGGEGHEAPDLTDTIIFSSTNHIDSSTTLISLPRDIWIPALRTKLNSVYYWGNQKQERGGGVVLAKSTVEEIVGKPVHYAVVFDFSSFKDIVDALGGIEVDVKNAFIDKKYPIPGKENDECGGDLELLCRYKTVEFKKGVQVMDGETALKFVRSRNAEGDEGTDLARSMRQQMVIGAIKNKVLSPALLYLPKRTIKVIKIIGESVETDLKLDQLAILARRALESKGELNTQFISEGLLVNPPISYIYDNLYVFIPKSGSWEEVHEWVRDILP